MKINLKCLADVITFGKHKNETLSEILRADPNYVAWLHESGAAAFTGPCLKEISEAGHQDVAGMIAAAKAKAKAARGRKRATEKKTEAFNALIKEGKWDEAEKYI